MQSLLRWIDERTGLRWLEERTGYHTAPCELGDRPVPRGTRLLRLWPTAILFTFVVEAVTGFFLWMFYSPSAQTAWESVYYLQHEVMGGWVFAGHALPCGPGLLGLIGLYILHMVFTRGLPRPAGNPLYDRRIDGPGNLGPALDRRPFGLDPEGILEHQRADQVPLCAPRDWPVRLQIGGRRTRIWGI